MTQMDPETSKNQIGMLKTFEINDSKPNWQKKNFPYQKCIIHLCRSFLKNSEVTMTTKSDNEIMNQSVIKMDTDIIIMQDTANDTIENVTIDVEECYVNDTNCSDIEADSIEPYFYK